MTGRRHQNGLTAAGRLAMLSLLLVGSLEAQSAAPFINQLSPPSIGSGTGTFNLIVFGNNFLSGAYVTWNGSPLTTTVSGFNQLNATVPGTLILNPGLVSVGVVNPGGFQSNFLGFVISSPPVSITTTSIPSAVAGTPYSTILTASGGNPPYTWSATTALPAGLTLNSAGTIAGTPSASGTFNFTVRAVDSLQAADSKSFSLSIALPPLSITTASLPAGTVGQAYSQTLAANGGTPPYRWLAGQGFPTGLALNATTGAITGTPTASGTFNFPVQVTDAAQGVAGRNLTLVINPALLAITTVPPLFNGTVGVAYAQRFSAAGGVPPYRWSILSGSTGGLTLDPDSGLLQGTPQNAGAFSFTIQVSDSVNARNSQTFSLSISPPALTITTPSALAAGTVGVPYSQTFSVVGGAPPYRWTLVGAGIPGLNLNSSQGTLTDIPTSPGTFTFSIQASDSAGITATKSFSLTINPAALRITSNPELPAGAIGSPYTFQMTATGGVLPYNWSANGLPEGLTLDAATGTISGTVAAAGSLAFTMRVTDSTRATAVDLFRITVNLPPAPPVTIWGLPGTAGPAQQFGLQMLLDAAFPSPISVQAILNFAPDAGGGDGTIQFASGGRTADFTIPQGATEPVFDVPLAIQTGTVAGTISVSLRLRAGGVDITPVPVPTISTRIERAAPVIRSARIIRNANGFNIEVVGFATSREVTQATFKFSAGGGKTLQTSEITIPLESSFNTWFQDSAATRFGSQFTMTQPFTIQGDASAVIAESVTLTNRLGNVTMPVTQ